MNMANKVREVRKSLTEKTINRATAPSSLGPLIINRDCLGFLLAYYLVVIFFLFFQPSDGSVGYFLFLFQGQICLFLER